MHVASYPGSFLQHVEEEMSLGCWRKEPGNKANSGLIIYPGHMHVDKEKWSVL